MGTRLYPCTKDPANLEKLCDVERGSYQRLQMLEEMTADYKTKYSERSEHDQEFDYELWKICNGNEDLSRLSAFLTFGWGKVNHYWLPDHVKCEGAVGGTDDPDQSFYLVHASDMGSYWHTSGKHPYNPDAEDAARLWQLCEGVCWH